MIEKVAKIGVIKRQGYLYFVDKEGGISRAKFPPKSDTIPEKVAKVNLKMDSGFLYFVDSTGDISRIKIKPKETLKSEKLMFYWNDIPLSIPKDIESLPQDKQDTFIKDWESGISTKSRPELGDKIKNIKDLPPLQTRLPEWLIDRVKEAMDQYVNQNWLSSIAVSGIVAEYLTSLLIEEFIKSHGIDKIIKFYKKLGNQDDRINLLVTIGQISKDEAKFLHDIRNTRNDFVHLLEIDKQGDKMKQSSLEVLKSLISFLNGKFWREQGEYFKNLEL